MSKRLSTAMLVIGIVLALGIGVVGTFVYRAKNEIVKTLRQVEWEDPLFDFPGLSPEERHEAAALIRESNQAMMSGFPQSFSSYRLYPYDFWEASAGVAEKRDRFLERPSVLKAWQMLGAETKAAEAYGADLQSLSRLFEASVRESASPVTPETLLLFLPGVATDIQTTRQAVGLLQTNSEALQKEVKLRRNCLFFGACEGIVRKPADLQNRAKTEYDAGSSPTLPLEHILRSGQYLNATILDGRLFSVNTECFGNTDRMPVFFLWQRAYPNAEASFYPKLTTNSYFRKLVDTFPYLPDETFLREAQKTYAWQPEANLYMCPDTDYYPHLATLYALVKFFESRFFSEELVGGIDDMTYQKLISVGKGLQEARIISPEIIAEYVDTLKEVERNLNDSASDSVKRKIRHYIRLWETQSGGLLEVFKTMRQETRLYQKRVENISRPLELGSTLASRSYASLLYAPWNPSVWRISKTPRFLFADLRSRDYIKDYWSLEQEFDQEEIAEIQELSARGVLLLK